ncbi:MAG TPA: HlyD family type I secretion periplasmic adaptor subunit [Nitrospira sp.]|nr:HlyD family type I secretion periplasmic adaptor subunit [Nitrospira sp.]
MALGVLGRQWIVWKAAWQAESGRPPNTAVPKGPIAEFLPEALDLQQVPSSPIGRALLWTIAIAFAIGAVWTTFIKIDSVMTAHGLVVPSGDSKTIHLSETGMLMAIHVQDGQTVKRGDVLLELASTRDIEARDRANKTHRATQVEAARLRALIKNQSILEAPVDGDKDEIRFQQRLLQDQLAEYQAKVAAARQLVDQGRATVEQTKEAFLQAKAVLLVETTRAEKVKKLWEYEVGSKADYLQAENQRLEKVQALIDQEKQLQQDRAALVEAEQQVRTVVSDFHQAKQAELSALEAKAALLAQTAMNANPQTSLQQLRSPINGVVQQLAVRTVGTMVTPAQPVLIVVPQVRTVEVETQVEDRDVKMVQKGQPVEIKVDASQVAPYGTILGHVLRVADRVTSIEQVGGFSSVRVGLNHSTTQIGNTEVTLVPGMTVTVEITTGQRRMIEYLVDPLLAWVNERRMDR